MSEPNDEIKEVKKSIDRERSNLLTVIAALSFLCISLFVSNISLGAYSLTASNERDAVSVALDDQRVQYYRCIRDQQSTSFCDQEMVSPPSRDILRDLESAGFTDILNAEEEDVVKPENAPGGPKTIQAYGLLGRIIY